MNNIVLDASAVLALINNEKGSGLLLASLPTAVICSVNLSEVVSKLTDRGLIETEIRADLDSFGFRVIDFDRELAYRSGLLRDTTKAGSAPQVRMSITLFMQGFQGFGSTLWT